MEKKKAKHTRLMILLSLRFFDIIKKYRYQYILPQLCGEQSRPAAGGDHAGAGGFLNG